MTKTKTKEKTLDMMRKGFRKKDNESEDDEGDGYSPKYTDFIKVKIHEYIKNI